jgi:hypothetical protein
MEETPSRRYPPVTIVIEVEIACVIFAFKDETRNRQKRFQHIILASSTMDFRKKVWREN